MRVVALLALAAPLALAGCAGGMPVDIPSAPAAAPRAIQAGTSAKPIQFRRIVIKINRGTRIGSLQGGFLCVPNSDLTWKGGRVTVNDDEFNEVFREELTKANYPVVGDPNSLFEDASEWKAELLVAGLVTDIKANLCVPPSGSSKGEAAMTVEWQVFSRLDRRVVHKVTTRGTGRLSEFTADGTNAVFHLAFAHATRALLADEGFHKLVSYGSQPTSPDIREAGFRLNPRAPFSGGIVGRIADVQSSVVTVFAGPGHGSGFFISGDGYVLTNEHVVRDAKFVKLKIATGREILGEVVATSPGRDVALIKSQESGFPPLPVAAEPPVGSDVYAFGSPLSSQLANSVTRGIVSAYRDMDGYRVLQSDTAIQPGNSGGPLTDGSGNAVAIAVAGISARGVMVGVNYFIPIDDALRSLGVERGEIADARNARAARMVRFDRPAPPKPEPAPPQVAAAPPTPAPIRLDGEYRGSLREDVVAGYPGIPMQISVHGSTITGHGQPVYGRANLLCRATGTVGSDGAAAMQIVCNTSLLTSVGINATGRFEPEPGTTDVVGRMHYVTSQGATGELVWRR